MFSSFLEKKDPYQVYLEFSFDPKSAKRPKIMHDSAPINDSIWAARWESIYTFLT